MAAVSLTNRPFTQEDPIGIAGGLNLYGYANGDPINFSDPFGLCLTPLLARMCIGAAAGAVVEVGVQIKRKDFDFFALVTAAGVGALSGGATRIAGAGGRYGAQALIGAGATALDGEFSYWEAIAGGVLGVTAERLGDAVASGVANKGLEAWRSGVFEKFEGMLQAGRIAEDVIGAAVMLDNVLSQQELTTTVGTGWFTERVLGLVGGGEGRE